MGSTRDDALAAYASAGRSSSRLSVVFRSAIADAAGMNSTDAECLDFLVETGSATAGRLAVLTGLTTGAITSVIRRLTSAGYIATEPDPADRRRLIITPREEHLAATAARYAAFESRSADLLSTYSDEELALLTRHYRSMSAIYEAEIARISDDIGSRTRAEARRTPGASRAGGADPTSTTAGPPASVPGR